MRDFDNMADEMFYTIEANIKAGKYGDPNQVTSKPYLGALQTYIHTKAGVNWAQAEIIVNKVVAEREGCSQAITLRYAEEMAEMFAAVNEANVTRNIQVRTVTADKDHRSCNFCYAQNYKSVRDTESTLHTDRIFEVVIGHMCVALCADCIDALKRKLDEAVEGGDR